MKLFEKLNHEQRKQLHYSIVEVSGKSKSRIALGVVKGMLKLYPLLTFDELKAKLPDEINVSAPKYFKSLFIPFSTRKYGVFQSGEIRRECEALGFEIKKTHFSTTEDTFFTIDGVEVLVSNVWESHDSKTGEDDLQKLIDHAATHHVYVIAFEEHKEFEKGNYFVELISHEKEDDDNKDENEKKELPKSSVVKLFFWSSLIVLLSTTFVIAPISKEFPIPISNPVPNIQPLSPICAIDIDKTSISFKVASDALRAPTLSTMDSIVECMRQDSNYNLRIIGQASIEGKKNFNLLLSKRRAKNTKEYFLSRGISSLRISDTGIGPIGPLGLDDIEDNRSKNRIVRFQKEAK